MAGLLKYFCCEPKQKLPVLPDLRDSLSEKVLIIRLSPVAIRLSTYFK